MSRVTDVKVLQRALNVLRVKFTPGIFFSLSDGGLEGAYRIVPGTHWAKGFSQMTDDFYKEFELIIRVVFDSELEVCWNNDKMTFWLRTRED